MAALNSTADSLVVQLWECYNSLSTRVDNLNTALAICRTELDRVHGDLTSVRDELETVRSASVQSADAREVQPLVTVLSQCVDTANVNSEMFVYVS